MVYSLLDRSLIYRLSQVLFAPGATKAISRKINSLLAELPFSVRTLDVGCGPASWLWRVGVRPIGLDLSIAYTKAFSQGGQSAVAGSAAALPFLDCSFDGVWSFGLLHHLVDEAARRCVGEMMRVTRMDGYVVIFDAVMPVPIWRHPLAFALRKSDRGRYIRSQEEFGTLLPSLECWICEREVYSHWGLEGLFCIYRKR